MIKINDQRRLLNLNPVVIYLMLSPEERNTYGGMLSTLNDDVTLTKGLFRFHIVEKGESPYEQLPADMIRATLHCNVFVRLINSIRGIFCYGLERVDLEAAPEVIKEQLRTFVDATCTENIMQLEILKPRGSFMSIQALKYYDAHQLFSEVFECALNLDTDDLFEARQLLENVTQSHSLQTSHDLMQEAVDNRLASRIEKERLETEAPEVRPEISVEMKMSVDTDRARKNGEPITGMGIEITINGETPIPICFTSIGGSHLTYLYFMLLMGKKEGISLRRSDFTEYGNRDTQRWLRGRFGMFLFDTTFDEYLATINHHGSAALINDAKSKINKVLWDILSPQYKEAYHYLCIVTKDKRKVTSKYELRLDHRQIKIDPPFFRLGLTL